MPEKRADRSYPPSTEANWGQAARPWGAAKTAITRPPAARQASCPSRSVPGLPLTPGYSPDGPFPLLPFGQRPWLLPSAPGCPPGRGRASAASSGPRQTTKLPGPGPPRAAVRRAGYRGLTGVRQRKPRFFTPGGDRLPAGPPPPKAPPREPPPVRCSPGPGDGTPSAPPPVPRHGA